MEQIRIALDNRLRKTLTAMAFRDNRKLANYLIDIIEEYSALGSPPTVPDAAEPGGITVNIACGAHILNALNFIKERLCIKEDWSAARQAAEWAASRVIPWNVYPGDELLNTFVENDGASLRKILAPGDKIAFFKAPDISIILLGGNKGALVGSDGEWEDMEIYCGSFVSESRILGYCGKGKKCRHCQIKIGCAFNPEIIKNFIKDWRERADNV
jgi:hypothetical protein